MQTEYRVQWEHYLPWAGWRTSTFESLDRDLAKSVYDQVAVDVAAKPDLYRNLTFAERKIDGTQDSTVWADST